MSELEVRQSKCLNCKKDHLYNCTKEEVGKILCENCKSKLNISSLEGFPKRNELRYRESICPICKNEYLICGTKNDVDKILCNKCKVKLHYHEESMILEFICDKCGQKYYIDMTDDKTPQNCSYCNGREEIPYMGILLKCEKCGQKYIFDTKDKSDSQDCPYCYKKKGISGMEVSITCSVCNRMFRIDSKELTLNIINKKNSCPYCNSQKETQHNTSQCPTCQSPDIQKLPTTQMVAMSGLFGMFKSRIRKSYHCNKCKYEW